MMRGAVLKAGLCVNDGLAITGKVPIGAG